MKGNLKKIIIIIAVLVVAFILFMFLQKDKDDSGALLETSTNGIAGITTDTSESGTEIVGAEIIQALNQINSLNLDRTIFERPIYLSLVDRSQEIPPEPVGRSNPFAPLNASNITTNVEDAAIDLESIDGTDSDDSLTGNETASAAGTVDSLGITN